MGEAAAVVGTVRGRRGSWLWSRPEANRRQSDLDERKREEFFDVLMMQADEARRRVREGTKWQGMPLLELCLRGRVLLPSRPGGLLEVKLLLLGIPSKPSPGEW